MQMKQKQQIEILDDEEPQIKKQLKVHKAESQQQQQQQQQPKQQQRKQKQDGPIEIEDETIKQLFDDNLITQMLRGGKTEVKFQPNSVKKQYPLLSKTDIKVDYPEQTFELEIEEFMKNEFAYSKQDVENGLMNIQKGALQELDHIFEKLINVPNYAALVEQNNARDRVEQFERMMDNILEDDDRKRYIETLKQRKKHDSYVFGDKNPSIKRYIVYICQLCKEKFRDYDEFHSHMREIHSFNLKNNYCNLCKRSFIHSLALASHLRAHHVFNGLFTCECTQPLNGDTKSIYAHIICCFKFQRTPQVKQMKKQEW